jgi:hypothetical protein
VSTLEDDRLFLESQLRQAKQQFLKLSEQLDRTQEHRSLPALVETEPKGNRSFCRTPAKPEDSQKSFNSGRQGILQQLMERYRPRDPRLLTDLEQYMTAQEQMFAEASSHYRRIIDTDRRRLQAIKSSRGITLAERTDLEAVFQDIVEQVRQEAADRRTALTMKRKYRLKTKEEASFNQPFTPADKRVILERLVSNSRVLSFLQENLSDQKKPEEPPQPVTTDNKPGFSFRWRRPVT